MPHPLRRTSTVALRYTRARRNSRRIGQLTRTIEASVTTVYCSDSRGNVLQKRQITAGGTDSATYAYTAADRLSSESRPDRTVIRYAYDSNGRINSVQVTPAGATTAPPTVVSAISYLPFGPISRYTLGNGQTSYVDPLGLACNDQGCWTTPGERSYLDNGNYLGYYQAACSGGDSYACFAQHVVANDDFWGHRATNRLTDAIEAEAKKNKQCPDEAGELNQIRSDLANAYANYLPDSEANARFPTDADIAQIHWNEFAKFGLPPSTFGGTPFGTEIPFLPVIWCPNCTRP